MKYILFAFVILLGAITAHSQETTKKIFCDKSKSTITYFMRHPLHEWEGVNKDVTSVILADEKRDKISQVAVSVKVASFDSKNANRDSHTMEVTEALKFPSITFGSTSIKQNGSLLKVTGMLSFHGIKKETTFDAKTKIEDGKLRVNGSFIVKMTEFGIDPPTLMALTTDDEIRIEFDILY